MKGIRNKGLAALTVMIVVFCISTFTSLAAEGTLKAEAKIRKETSTESEVVGSAAKGKKVDILGAVKDSGGTVWYKVSVAGGGYGYIRSDLIEASGDIPVTESTGTAVAAGNTQEPADTVPTSIGEQQAVISSEKNVRVRTGASTQHNTVASLPKGTSITLIGEANDNAGNKWYQMTCSYNGRNVEGYVRSDLIAIGSGENTEGQNTEGQNTGETAAESAEGAEGTEGTEGTEGAEGAESTEGTEGGDTGQPAEGEAPADQPAEPPAEEHRDYEIVYAQNAEGGYEYYLYNNIEGTKQSLNNLFTVVNSAQENMEKLQEQAKNEKIIIIILAVVIVILFIVLTVLLFKLRDVYADYEDEEEEEEEPEPVPEKRRPRRRQIEEEEEQEPVRKKKSSSAKAEERPVRAARTQTRTRQDQELYAAEKKEPVRKRTTRKPQNFLVDDDEFEFEFLNMDDKDL